MQSHVLHCLQCFLDLRIHWWGRVALMASPCCSRALKISVDHVRKQWQSVASSAHGHLCLMPLCGIVITDHRCNALRSANSCSIVNLSLNSRHGTAQHSTAQHSTAQHTLGFRVHFARLSLVQQFARPRCCFGELLVQQHAGLQGLLMLH